MSYSLSITPEPGYLHALVIGDSSRATIEAYLAELLRECQTRNCRRLLVEEHLEGPCLGRMDIFQIVSAISIRARGQFEAIAFVDAIREGGLIKYAENLANNRNLPVVVFVTVNQAERWLQGWQAWRASKVN